MMNYEVKLVIVILQHSSFVNRHSIFKEMSNKQHRMMNYEVKLVIFYRFYFSIIIR
jgi:hypothetical protein